MSTTLSVAANPAGAPELHHTRENNGSFVTCRVLVNCRIQSVEVEWVSDEPSARNIKFFGLDTTRTRRVRSSSGDTFFVQGIERIESWPRHETGENRSEHIVVLDSRFGEAGLSLKNVSSPIERAPYAAGAN
ncbi:MAG TPA: hypothetical protein PLZ93_10320 [Nocardioides sp.]|uniref:hypothetical protein n=1 Tax=uncultured Nocardioides sp. TaxID=198441 RepID=UPI000EDAF676|nr:hypothetical protein [uncultured Nocardioides sp.]HCB02859.1 hypothetical protein [Nocardioides sp.]HRI95999.1 hypothetical protein [Nocardioides sp.]HRK45922.1 hypothetical protein [Nocardioides sp.]